MGITFLFYILHEVTLQQLRICLNLLLHNINVLYQKKLPSDSKVGLERKTQYDNLTLKDRNDTRDATT